jgi:hypothetical protein
LVQGLFKLILFISDAAAKPKKVEKVKFNDEKKPQPDSPKDNETDNSG